ncbi:MAG TPA: hypothetical protein VEC06_00055 [Paucimonas sp.]|nr:hypothetical protein [Paucimonas sp.]
MKIEASSISFAGSHRASARVEVRETMRAWIGDRRPDFEGIEAGRPQREARALPAPDEMLAFLSGLPDPDEAAAQAAQEAQALAEAADAVERDPKLLLLKLVIEILSGRPVKTISLDDMRALEQQRACLASQQAQAAPRAGFGVEYDRHEVRTEHEQMRFAAEGIVRTADGKEIRFQLALAAERSYREESNVSLRAGDGVRKDPLVINFDGTSAQLQSTRFSFDLDGDGTREDVPLLAGNRGYLALDLDGNGKVDSGKELFGTASGDGFADLARYDDDGNGWIDEGDAVFDRLLVWKPAAGGGQLQALREHGVGALSLGRVETPFELKGEANAGLGAVRSSGIYLNEDGSAGSLQQIDVMV